MRLFKTFTKKFSVLGERIHKITLIKKLIALVLLIAIGFGVWQVMFNSQSTQVSYETTTAEKGTLITSISGSGTISSGNNTSITTKVSGVISKVYVTNGDTVAKGQKIADVNLDDYAKERQTAAWVSYLDAQEAVKTAQKAKVQADLQMWKDNKAIFDAIEDIDYKNENTTNPDSKEDYTDQEKTIIDKTLEVARASFTESELKYKNADSEIAAASTKVTSVLRDYQENSATIIAPVGGVIRDLSLASGITIAASTATSNTSGQTIVSAQTVGKISDPEGQLIASVSLSEIDVISVKANQKVTITLDAYEDITFTGKVLSVDTSGITTQNVTSYPVKILLDPVTVEIYPNMAVNVQIITSIKSDIITIPTTAITTANGESSVQVKKGDQVTTVQVTLGTSNESQTEIVSGLNVGDEVVTSVINADSDAQTDNNETSPFSGMGTNSSSNRNSGNSIPGAGGPPGGF